MLLVVLSVMAGLLAWYVWGQPAPASTADRPVVMSEVRRAAAVSAAQQHAKTILDKDHEEYDAQTEAALDLIVDGSDFEQEYEETAADVRESFVAEEVELEYTVVGASVVRGDEESVQALLFLNQFTKRKGAEAQVTPYRALVTVVPSGSGWRVQQIETR